MAQNIMEIKNPSGSSHFEQLVTKVLQSTWQVFVESTQIDFVLCVGIPLKALCTPSLGPTWKTPSIFSPSPLFKSHTISENGDLTGVLGVVYNTWPLLYFFF